MGHCLQFFPLFEPSWPMMLAAKVNADDAVSPKKGLAVQMRKWQKET